MQVINQFFGGKIKNLENSKHVNSPHLVNINSNLSLDEKQFEVNSFHHNIIHSEDLGKDITSFAVSVDDNTVEGLIHNNFSIYGVMWHPERNPDNNSVNLLKKIFNHI